MIMLKDITSSVKELEPLPPTGPKLALLLADSGSTAADIAGIIRYDQALTLDILKYANSAASASSRKIADVKDAVIRIGAGRVLEMVVARHVRATMNSPMESYGYSENDMWRHSVASAVAAEKLETISGLKTGGMSFTAALLHDIGKLILSRLAPAEQVKTIVMLLNNDPARITCEQAEKAVLGFSHAEVGASVAESWGLPAMIVQAIRYHHSTDKAQDSVTDAVRLANLAARTIGEGIGIEGMSLAVDSGLAARANISREQFEWLCVACKTALNDVLLMYEA